MRVRLDVRGLTDITDTMVVASGTSDRHVKSIADRVLQRCKEAGYRPYGLEGEFLEIDAPRTLMHTWHGIGAPGAPTTVTYLLEASGPGTRLTLRHAGFASREACHNHRANQHHTGFTKLGVKYTHTALITGK